ncbi:MAG: TraR/DksA C4-type zinc finger protein [Sedimentisphaerales bacterium]|nr:TraR/DksA C4-type zinc finger protein [Sedimentisphaerales bacterium]
MAKKKEVKKRPVRRKSTKRTAVKKEPAVIYTKTSEYLTDQEVEHYSQLLREKMQELIGDVNSIEDGALKKSRLDASGDLSSMPIHMADIGTDNYDQEFALNLLDSERRILNEIVDALRRIDEQVYGICEVTGRGIPKARLEARPWARYCIEYARLVEKGLVRAGEPVPEGIELE